LTKMRVMWSLAAAAALLTLAVAPAGASVIRVPADEPSIQDGVSAAGSGDTVLVYPGTYSGPDNRDVDFGGLDIVLRSLGGAEVTVVDCEHEGRALHLHGGEGRSAIVQGLTFTNGEMERGGAVLCEGSSPTFRECVIEGNRGTLEGAGIACYGAAPLVDDCYFAGNSSEIALYGCAGGLLAADGSSVELMDTVFFGNGSDMGGALAARGGSTVALSRCLVFGNGADSGGALACLGGSNIAVEHCTISDNISVAGTGIFCDGSSSAEASATILAFGYKGTAAFCVDGGTVTLECCDVYSNEYGDWTGCIEDQQGVNGNISEDPLFCGPPHPLKRYSLHADSPCAVENYPECGGIGALGVGCDATALEDISWGAFKSRYRSR